MRNTVVSPLVLPVYVPRVFQLPFEMYRNEHLPSELMR